jgi:hypothetical protein
MGLCRADLGPGVSGFRVATTLAALVSISVDEIKIIAYEVKLDLQNSSRRSPSSKLLDPVRT